MSPARSATVGVLAVTIAAATLAFDTALFNQFHLPQALVLRLLTACALALSLLWFGTPGGGTWRRTAVDPVVLLFGGWLILRTIGSISSAVSWNGEYGNADGTLLQLHLLALFFLSSQAVRSRAEKATVFLAATLAGIVESSYILLQSAGLDFVRADVSFAAVGRFDGTSGNPIAAGAVIAVTLTLAAALLATPDRGALRARVIAMGIALLAGSAFWLLRFAASGVDARVGDALREALSRPALWFLGLGLMCAAGQLVLVGLDRSAAARWVAAAGLGGVLLRALAETGSRSALIGLAVGGVAVLALAWAGARRRRSPSSAGAPRPRALGPALAVLGLVAVGLLAGLGTPSGGRFLDAVRHPLDALGHSRANIWLPALEMVRARPLAGWGVDSFARVFPAYETGFRPADVAEQAVPGHAHSEPLMILSTLGLVGLGLWIALLILWGRAAVKAQFDEDEPGARRLQLGGLAALGVLLGYGLFGIPSVPLRAMFWTVLALTLPARPVSRSLPWSVPRLPRLALAMALVALEFYGVASSHAADRAYKAAFVAWKRVESVSSLPPAGALATAAGALARLPQPIADPLLAATAGDLQGAARGIEAALAGTADARQAREMAGRYATLALLLKAALAQQRAVALRPSEPQYEWFLGEVYARRYELFPGDERKDAWFDRGRGAYQAALARSRRDAFGAASLGRLYFQRWLLERDAPALSEARRWYATALELAPLVRPFLRDAISLELSAGRPDAALVLVEQTGARAPVVAAEVLAGHPLGASLCAEGRVPRCRELARRALAVDARSPAARAILEQSGR